VPKSKDGHETLAITANPHDTQMLRMRRRGESLTLPTIRVVAGPDMIRFCSIYPGERVVIGRDEGCELTLVDASVSRRHASISSSDDGETLLLEDLGSTNGTSYNEDPVHAPVPIELGEPVQIGSVTLRVDRMGLDELAHLARVVERLRMASTDPLTGLLGRHYLEQELPRRVARFHRASIPISCVFFDIDNFKSINDTYDHALGDEVLRTVARIVLMCIRDSDTAVRYGGEEFVIFLPNCDEDGGVRLADRVREKVEAHDWSAHQAAEDGKPALAVTVSLGVAEYDGRDIQEWIRVSDRAMYRAKETGKNKVVRASVL